MIGTIIVDDEPLARQRLRRLLSAHPDVEILDEAEDGDRAVAACLAHRPALLLLDVNMPERDGTSAVAAIARQLPEGLRPLVVFVTAHEEHAVEAFDLDAVDFIVKPVSAERLERALRRVRQRLWEREGGQTSPPVTAAPPPEPATAPAPGPTAAPSPVPAHLVALDGSKMLRLPLAEVAVIETRDGQVIARAESGEFRLQETLAELEERLPSPPFVRVSRGALLQLDWVAHLEPGFRGSWVVTLRAPFDGEVPVARRRVAALRAML